MKSRDTDIHIDENDTQAPDVRGLGLVSRSHVVATLVGHVRRAPAVHVGGLLVAGREAEVRELDDDTASRGGRRWAGQCMGGRRGHGKRRTP